MKKMTKERTIVILLAGVLFGNFYIYSSKIKSATAAGETYAKTEETVASMEDVTFEGLDTIIVKATIMDATTYEETSTIEETTEVISEIETRKKKSKKKSKKKKINNMEKLKEITTVEWNGQVLNQSNGRISGPQGGDETYYNKDMSGVVKIMEKEGFYAKAWEREDGVKMYGDYIMCAANLQKHPRGTLVQTSLGIAIVCDTGDFAETNPKQLDIAANWPREND